VVYIKRAALSLCVTVAVLLTNGLADDPAWADGGAGGDGLLFTGGSNAAGGAGGTTINPDGGDDRSAEAGRTWPTTLPDFIPGRLAARQARSLGARSWGLGPLFPALGH
jgi:hypothetical protein